MKVHVVVAAHEDEGVALGHEAGEAVEDQGMAACDGAHLLDGVVAGASEAVLALLFGQRGLEHGLRPGRD